MGERGAFEADVASVIAHSKTVPHGDDDLWKRVLALVRGNPELAIDIGEPLLTSSDPDEREMAIRLVGVAGVIEDGRLRERVRPVVREALRRETEPGAILWAIIELEQLADAEALDLVLSHRHDDDPEVREVVASSLPIIAMDAQGRHDAATLAALRELTTDEDGDVRDWATFGIGQQDDTDDEVTRETLYARLADQHGEARMEAIVGLARRRDERVRPFLMRELADPEHGEIFELALQVLDGEYNYLAIESDEARK